MNEEVILTVIRYADRYLFEPDRKWSREDFKNRSYERFAADTYISLLLDNPYKDPLDILEELQLAMMYCKALTPKQSRSMFQTILWTLDDISELLKKMEERQT